MDDHTSPLQPDELDELLSADLDGELAAAALDLGLSTDDAAARLRATPGMAERRAALAAARDLLREPTEIEELLAARLRAKAVRAAEQDNAVGVSGVCPDGGVEWGPIRYELRRRQARRRCAGARQGRDGREQHARAVACPRPVLERA